MEDLSLHILDIAENSINANAKNIEISLIEEKEKDLLTLVISDDGIGMTKDFAQDVTNPFQTTRMTRKVGLGLAFLEEATKSANGKLTIESTPNIGTKITATFQLSHIDRKPIGNIAETIVMLIAGNPDVDIKYNHCVDELQFIFDTKDIREIYPNIPINLVNVLSFIRKYISENINLKK